MTETAPAIASGRRVSPDHALFGHSRGYLPLGLVFRQGLHKPSAPVEQRSGQKPAAASVASVREDSPPTSRAEQELMLALKKMR